MGKAAMKTIIHFLIIASVLTFTVSGQEIKQTEKSSQIVLSEEDVIREILFSRILPKNQSVTEEKKQQYVCLSVDDGLDASKDLLVRFTDYESKNGVKIKKASECYFYAEGGIILSGEPLKGTIFYVSKLSRKNESEVKAKAGSQSETIGGNGCVYTLKKENGRWKIVSAEACYVN